MFPYDVSTGRVQAIFGNLFSKTETLQFYNTGFYILDDMLTFVGGTVHFQEDIIRLPSQVPAATKKARTHGQKQPQQDTPASRLSRANGST